VRIYTIQASQVGNSCVYGDALVPSVFSLALVL
jgi:hypothetical protein